MMHRLLAGRAARRLGRSGAWAASAALAVSLVAADARAFCRTSTCPLPPDFAPRPGACTPPDFESYCASLHPPVKPLPVWWRNACVGYDLQKDASRQVSLEVVSKLATAAFAKWTSVTCPAAGGGDGGASAARVSIDARDLGPVSCGQVEYNADSGNSHVIVFRDDEWPHQGTPNTLALTTLTFDTDTGEIYDADIEINGTVALAAADPVSPDAYDLLSILTHEAGHFLGLAHSDHEEATMFASYQQGSIAKRSLSADDEAGLCSIYRPDGKRAADPSVGGPTAEESCDPKPRHGFASDCAGTSSRAR